MIKELLRAERQAGATEPPYQAPQPLPGTDQAIVSLAPAPGVGPPAGSRLWLGEAIKLYLENLKRKGKHSEGTLTYTIAPSLRVFRELVSGERRPCADKDTAGTWDISLGEVTPERFDGFVEAFWNFPARQGKRPVDADAKEVASPSRASWRR